MGNCEHLAVLAVCVVIEVQQIHLDSFLEIPLEQHFPPSFGAIDLDWTGSPHTLVVPADDSFPARL